MEFLTDYGIFLLKVITIALAITLPLLFIIGSSKSKNPPKGSLVVKNLSKKFEDMGSSVRSAQLNPKELKKYNKELQKSKKQDNKKPSKEDSVYVLNFNGDIQASEVTKLKHEINAILLSDTKCKEVVIKVESGGGSAYAYGLCAAELKRLVDNKIKLTVCIDKVAASGGYLMSCVATKIIAAPWAIVGSIGVIAQLPNFHRLLKKNSIDFEMHTAGEFKRTLTTLGENTEAGRKKFKSELEDLHLIFKDFVKEEPQIWNDKLKNEIYDACKTIVEHEDAFIDLAFQMGPLEGLTADQVKQYIRFIGNRRLEQLGLNPIYDVKKNPLTWLDTMLNGVEHMNFFEGRATEYSKASTRGTWGEVFA